MVREAAARILALADTASVEQLKASEVTAGLSDAIGDDLTRGGFEGFVLIDRSGASSRRSSRP
jgi:hypothetical protein